MRVVLATMTGLAWWSGAAVPPTVFPVRMAMAQDTGGVSRYVITATGNEARYRVREQLAGVDFPNDAVGVATALTGQILVDATGRVVPDSSRIVVDLRTLKSDRSRRDGYIQRRTLETADHPLLTLVPRSLGALPWPLLEGDTVRFELTGDLTLKAVTRPTTWEVEAARSGDTVSGRATTRFTFEHFRLEKPRVAVVLSVEDAIRLEYDFRLVRTPATP